ncbi:MAG: Galactose oxidase [Caulobacteraceae bacterium]|nr:Galactose oxidase [Caulobacteraceae bacterium]
MASRVILSICLFALTIMFAPDISLANTHPAMDEMDMTGAMTGAPVDYGLGPGRGRVWAPPPSGPGAAKRGLTASAKAGYVLGSVSPGPSNAGVAGYFDPPVSWPINGLHEILLPDGRVLNYGSSPTGSQTAQFIYDVWTPSLGVGSNAHTVLPNTTQTDIFCSEQSMIWSTGQVLITGGDMTTSGTRNYSNNATTIFSPQTNTIAAAGSMTYARWYPSMVAMPNGDMVTLGGRLAPFVPATTPEVYNPATGWRVLTGANSTVAFANNSYGWYYPRAFLKSDGTVFILDAYGHMWSVNTAGFGTISQYPGYTAAHSALLPVVMYAPDKILFWGVNFLATTVNYSGAKPVSTPAGAIDQMRYYSNATVMADGTVLVNGGSAVANQLPGDLTALIWSPVTRAWTTGASAVKARLYHSIALLLPDATVLTGGGGSPGPVTNLNAEIYYPPYLYLNDGSGMPAPRPTLAAAPPAAVVGQTVAATVGLTDVISRVTFVRTGSVTHTHNNDQRFIDAAFAQNGNVVTATLPTNANVMVPGYYMMFVHQNGVPSVSQIILVTAQ